MKRRKKKEVKSDKFLREASYRENILPIEFTSGKKRKKSDRKDTNALTGESYREPRR